MSFFHALKKTNEGQKRAKILPFDMTLFLLKPIWLVVRAEHWDTREWRFTSSSTSDLKASLGQDASLSVPEFPGLKRQDNDIDL